MVKSRGTVVTVDWAPRLRACQATSVTPGSRSHRALSRSSPRPPLLQSGCSARRRAPSRPVLGGGHLPSSPCRVTATREAARRGLRVVATRSGRFDRVLSSTGSFEDLDLRSRRTGGTCLAAPGIAGLVGPACAGLDRRPAWLCQRGIRPRPASTVFRAEPGCRKHRTMIERTSRRNEVRDGRMRRLSERAAIWRERRVLGICPEPARANGSSAVSCPAAVRLALDSPEPAQDR
jgi:hypothetical protein